MKINYGCGRQVLDGFTNIDAVRNAKAPRDPEILFAMRFTPDGDLFCKTPLENGCADYLQAMHVIEHFYAWEVPAVLSEWKRLLRNGGRLVLELPNLEAACRNLIAGRDDQMTMWPLYGDPSHKDQFMCHRWAYTPKTIAKTLESSGFYQIDFAPPQTHGRRSDRDMRVEALR